MIDIIKTALDRLKDGFLLGEWARLPELATTLADAVGLETVKPPTIVDQPDQDGIRRSIGDCMRALDDLRYKPPDLWPAIFNGRFRIALTSLAFSMELEVDKP